MESFPKTNLAITLTSLDAEHVLHCACQSVLLHSSLHGLQKNADVALSYTGTFSRMLYHHCYFFPLTFRNTAY